MVLIKILQIVGVRLIQAYWAIRLRWVWVWERDLDRAKTLCERTRSFADATFFGFRPDVAQWCRTNLRHPHGIAPSFSDPKWSMGESRRIWFTDKNEAFLFRVTWL